MCFDRGPQQKKLDSFLIFFQVCIAFCLRDENKGDCVTPG